MLTFETFVLRRDCTLTFAVPLSGGRLSYPFTLYTTECCSASMASSLIGISVAVTLQNPPNTIVQGTVAAVNSQTSTLILQNGQISPPRCFLMQVY
jgi:hypothetical protein